MSTVRDRKILLVEDQSFILNVIHELLVSAGFKHVDKSSSAEAAIELMQKSKYDLIITDIEMEKINGIELLKLIRTGKTPLSPATRVIILTSHASTQALGTAVALDANGFLVKPAKLDKTVEKIQEAFAEDFKPRRAIGYSVISTEVVDKPEEPKQSNEEQKPEEPEEEETVSDEKEEMSIIGDNGVTQKTICVMIDELQPGMAVAEAIKNNQGGIILTSGHILTEHNITRLKDIREQLAQDYVRIIL